MTEQTTQVTAAEEQQQTEPTAPVVEEQKTEKPEAPVLKRTSEIEYPFDVSNVPENEISLIKKWLDDIVFDETETKNHNLALTYPVALCNTDHCFALMFNEEVRKKTAWSGLRNTSAYEPCGIITQNEYIYKGRDCKERTDRVPCRMWLCAMYKYLKEFRPEELARQREAYMANKDMIDHEHLYIPPCVKDITAPVKKLPFIPSAQIKRIRRLIDKHEYNLFFQNDYYTFQSGTEKGIETATISARYYNWYVSNSDSWNYRIHIEDDDGKNLERFQYLFITKLLTQSLEKYNEYVTYIKKCEDEAISLYPSDYRGHSYYGYIAGNDRDEVAAAVKNRAISLCKGFKLCSSYVHVPAMEVAQHIAKVDSSNAYYNPIEYKLFKNDTIYLITGLKEFTKAYKSLDNDYTSPIRRQFEHLIKQIRPFAEHRFILLAGTKDEIEDFLALDASFGLLFERNEEVIEDKTVDELYELYKKNVEENSSIALTGANEKDFKDFCTYNRNIFPFRNSSLASYLADYTMNKGAYELPNNLSNMREEDFMRQLDMLVGMDDIKETVKQFYNYVKYKKAAQEQGIQLKDANLHMLFTGSPGTGKTTVARIIAKALYDIGIIEENKLVEVERKDLVAEYVGQTAPKTDAVIEKALNGVLFIDEAYSLTPVEGVKDYGDEAITTLIKAMEDKKNKLVVIFAGYKAEMERFVDSNPGIQSRIGYTFHFNDYNDTELLEIFNRKMKASGLTLDPECEDLVKSVIRYFAGSRNIGNGRFIDKLYQIIVQNRAKFDDTNLGYIDRRCIPSIQDVIDKLPQKGKLIAPERVSCEEKQRVAYHELGHALVMITTGHDNIQKITVTASASGALGYLELDTTNDSVLKTEKQYSDQLCQLMAGLAAEKIIYGSYGGGGTDDISKARKIARHMILDCGMSRLGFAPAASRVDDEINAILSKEYERACDILREKRDAMDALCEQLLDKETVGKSEIHNLFHIAETEEIRVSTYDAKENE